MSIHKRKLAHGPCMAYCIDCYEQPAFQLPGGRHTWSYTSQQHITVMYVSTYLPTYPPTYPATYWSTCQFGSPRAGYPLSRANRRWYLQHSHICLLFLLPPLPPPSMNHSCYHCHCNQHTHEQYPTNPCWYCSYQCAWALTHHIHSGARGDHSCWWGGVAC